MKLFLFYSMLFFGLTSFSQKPNSEKEITETINWLNLKLTQYQYESSEVKQVFTILRTEKIQDDIYLVCLTEQWTNNSLLTKNIVKIPILKINSIAFSEKMYNYWLDIKIKGNNSEILVFPKSGNNYSTDSESILLMKSIDSENLRPRIQRAFKFLLEQFGNKTIEKF